MKATRLKLKLKILRKENFKNVLKFESFQHFYQIMKL